MPRPYLQIKLVDTRLPRLPKQLRALAAKGIRKIAFDIEAGAKSRLTEGHGVDTGAMQAGIYVATHDETGYELAAAQVRGLNPKATIFPEVTAPDELTAIVAGSVEYEVYQEFGTIHQEGNPHLQPAAEQARPEFEAMMGHLVGELGK
jgi:hypothetical protein